MSRLVPILFLLAACTPGLPEPESFGEPEVAEPAEDRAPYSVTVLPHGHLARAPRALRLRVRRDAAAGLEPLDAGGLLLFEGELSAGQLAGLGDARIPHTLEERRVDVLAWRNSDDEAIVAPTVLLAPGATYTLASVAPPFAVNVTIDDADAVPTLTHAWPPGGRSASGAQAIWCGEAPLPELFEAVTLVPRGVPAVLQRGVAPGELATRCVNLESAALPPLYKGELLPPLLVRKPGAIGLAHAVEESLARLEPLLLSKRTEPLLPSLAASCPVESIAVGPACAAVADDRLVLTTPDAPLFFSIVEPGGALEEIFAASGGDIVVHPLVPSSTTTLAITLVDEAGFARSLSVPLTTSAPRSHVVLSEVLANPIGPEPAQEWIELYNDGLVAAELGGYRIKDVGGETVLPSASLEPGGYALVVGEDYLGDGAYDVPPAPGALVLRVPKLGKSGLANAGEPLELLDAEGSVVSRFAAVKTKAGRSVYRPDPKALDVFAMSAEEAATPGAENDGT